MLFPPGVGRLIILLKAQNVKRVSQLSQHPPTLLRPAQDTGSAEFKQPADRAKETENMFGFAY
jgi:hypothetical protein